MLAYVFALASFEWYAWAVPAILGVATLAALRDLARATGRLTVDDAGVHLRTFLGGKAVQWRNLTDVRVGLWRGPSRRAFVGAAASGAISGIAGAVVTHAIGDSADPVAKPVHDEAIDTRMRDLAASDPQSAPIVDCVGRGRSLTLRASHGWDAAHAVAAAAHAHGLAVWVE